MMLKNKVVKNGAYLVLLQVFNTILPLLTVPYITRILGAEGYGRFSTALNWVTYFQIIVEYGFALSGASKVVFAKTDDDVNKTYNTILISRILLALISFGAMIAFALFSNREETQLVCMVILFSMVIGTVLQENWLFQGKQDMRPIAVISVIARSISTALIFIFVHSKEDIYLYCIFYSITYLITGVVSQVFAHRKYRLHLRKTPFREVLLELKDGGYLFISTAMSKLFGGIGITILGFVATDTDVGIYSAINKIPSIGIMFFLAVSQAIYPYICENFAKSDADGRHAVRRIAIPFMGLVLIGSSAIVALRYWLVNLFCGPEYTAQANLVIPGLVWMALSILNNFLGVQSLVAAGRQKEYGIAFLIETAFLIGYNFLFTILFGLYGVAWAAVASEATLTLILIVTLGICRKRKKEEVS